MNDNDFEKDFLSISEFAEFVDITDSSLRHYDKRGIFSPAKSHDEFGNKHRYYSPIQITTIKMIRVLTEIRVPLETIKELAQNRTPVNMLRLLRKHSEEIRDKINSWQEIYSVIQTFSELLYDAITVTENEISVSEMPEKRIILGDSTDFSGTTSFYREFMRFCHDSHEPKLNMAYPVGGY